MGWEWEAGKEQGRLASRSALGRNCALEAGAGGSSGRGELNTSVPNVHSVPEHLIHTWLTSSIIFTLNVAVGRFPSGSVILFAACDSHLFRLTGMSLLTLLEKVTALNLALFANVTWDAVFYLHCVFKNICRDIPSLLPFPHSASFTSTSSVPWEARASTRPPLCSLTIWGLYQPFILLW